MLIVAALTVIGAALRFAVARQSLFGDEISTYWIVSGNDLPDVISTVDTDAEITPPLYFVATWLATRIDLTPELLRAPSLIAGVAAIPLVYALGARTVGRRAALLAAAFCALSPFMIFYSAEARGYELMVVLVLLSTLALLAAIDSRRTLWWVAYAACACAAVYTHYTSVFALAGQLLWALWAHPEARRPALLASGGAAVAFLPWLPGLKGDLDSATTDILSALQPFELDWVRISLTHWAIGHPFAGSGTGLRDLPGEPALVLFALGLLVALAGVVRERRSPPALDRRAVLVVVLALSVPAGEAVASAFGSNLFGTRNLAASWPAYALCLAGFLLAGGRRLGVAAAALALAAFAIGAVKMVDEDFQRHDYDAVAAAVEERAGPRDVVVDGASLSPAGLPPALRIAFERPPRTFQLNRDEVTYDPFRIVAPAPPVAGVVEDAAAATDGGRIFFVLLEDSPLGREATGALPPGFERVETRTWPGIDRVVLDVYERR
jgi:mannosyltransferase